MPKCENSNMQTSEVYGSEESTGVLIEPLGAVFHLVPGTLQVSPKVNLIYSPFLFSLASTLFNSISTTSLPPNKQHSPYPSQFPTPPQ
jgi:hypothetical protein